jgi:hypothetical protein
MLAPVPLPPSSKYRGVAAHKQTGRFESHLWLDGKQVYLGSFDTEEAAARVFDRACLRFRGDLPEGALNFPEASYADTMPALHALSSEEAVVQLRRESQGFARGACEYRGVSWRPSTGRWEARIGRFLGKRYQYLGTFSSGEDAARAYDRAAVASRGKAAVTNFHLSQYAAELQELAAASEDELPAVRRRIAFAATAGKCSRLLPAKGGAAKSGRAPTAASPPAARRRCWRPPPPRRPSRAACEPLIPTPSPSPAA